MENIEIYEREPKRSNKYILMSFVACVIIWVIVLSLAL